MAVAARVGKVERIALSNSAKSPLLILGRLVRLPTLLRLGVVVVGRVSGGGGGGAAVVVVLATDSRGGWEGCRNPIIGLKVMP